MLCGGHFEKYFFLLDYLIDNVILVFLLTQKMIILAANVLGLNGTKTLTEAIDG